MNNKNEIKSWMGKDGVLFLYNIGLKKGQSVLDYGCGEGHYTIPAAEVVEKDGMVYAFDKDKEALNSLSEAAKKYGAYPVKL